MIFRSKHDIIEKPRSLQMDSNDEISELVI